MDPRPTGGAALQQMLAQFDQRQERKNRARYRSTGNRRAIASCSACFKPPTINGNGDGVLNEDEWKRRIRSENADGWPLRTKLGGKARDATHVGCGHTRPPTRLRADSL